MKKVILILFLATQFASGAKDGKRLEIGGNEFGTHLRVQIRNFEGREMVFFFVKTVEIFSLSFPAADEVYSEAKQGAPCMSSFKLNKKTGTASVRVFFKGTKFGEKDIVVTRVGPYQYEWSAAE